MAKGIKSGLSIAAAWAKLFIENEERASAGNKRKKPFTDAQLIEKMQADFPDSAEKTTITRVPRGIYNKGTNMFKAQGPSGTDERPKSEKYDDAGNIISGRRGPKAKKTEEKKAPAKKPARRKRRKKAAATK